MTRATRRTITLAVLAASAAAAAAQPAERLLLGFEDAETQRLAKLLKATRKESKAKDGTAVVTLTMPRAAGFTKWNIQKGRASQGECAAVLRPTRVRLYLDRYKGLPADSLLAQSVAYYGVFQDNWAVGAGNVFLTLGAHRGPLPKDWSACDLLRMDVYCPAGTQTFRVVLEDAEIAPPVIRSMTVGPGKWTTLEVDLRAAAKDRGLDLKRMVNLVVAVVKVEGKGRIHYALLDHLRLSRKGAPAKLPVVRDDRPHTLPECFRASTKPQPEKMPPGKADHTPLKPAEPILIKTEVNVSVAPVGWVSAYDNRRLMVGFNAGRPNALVLQSMDAGKSWRGLDGGAKPTMVRVPEITHQCGPGDVVGRRGDAIILTNIGCNSAALASMRLFAQKLTLTGEGWALRKLPALVGCDLRHCNSNQSVVRTADGRLWAAYGLVGRLGTQCINVRYSDDDGVTWRASRPGTSGVIPDSVRSDKGGGSYGHYTFQEPRLVPWGEAVACLWRERKGYGYTQLKWTRFDGKRWSAVETIKHPKRSAYNPTRPPIWAVSVGRDEIFLVSALFDGVLHYRKGKWTVEAPDVPAGSRISVAGATTVVVITGVSDKAKLRESSGLSQKTPPVVLRCRQRRGDGTWSPPREIAREDTALASHGGRYYARPGFVVQPYAPPNFVPVAWTCGKKWIKLLRVPVTR